MQGLKFKDKKQQNLVLKLMYGCEYDNPLLSAHSGPQNFNAGTNIREFLTNQDVLSLNKNILILDDNMGTEKSMKMLVNSISRQGHSCKYGAVQFNWINYNNFKYCENYCCMLY